jgi:hypothetical protein
MTIDIGAPSGVDPLLELFAQCVVRVDVDGSFAGSGFYIAPGEVLTCAHVVHGGKAITVGEGWAANPTTQLLPPGDAQAKFYPQPDAVLLHVADAATGHPCVRLADQRPATDDQLQLRAWVKNENAPGAVARSGASLRMETTFEQDGWTLFKLREGQVIKGFSGGPVLNRRTGDVCALIDSSRGVRFDLGGFGVPVAAVATLDPGLLKRNIAFHTIDRRWTDAVKAQRVAEDDRADKLLLSRASDERNRSRPRPATRLDGRAVTSEDGQLPLVEQFTDWARLGVHHPITRLSSGVDLSGRLATGVLPSYVLREKDRMELRPALRGAGPPARLVLVTGESLAGKSRAAMEAMREELPKWRLLIPRGAGQLGELLDEQFDMRHTVVWLDEVQEFLGQTEGVEQLDRVLDLRDGPTVVLATLRTDAENALRGGAGWRRLDREGDVCRRITLYRRPIPDHHEVELGRARALRDPWLDDALASLEDRYGLAEWLAAGPQLLRELDRLRAGSDMQDRLTAAVVDAAIDCYLAGYTDPVPLPLLADASRLYASAPPCEKQLPTDPVFVAALCRARRAVAGATGLLVHHQGWGERAFDYLLQDAFTAKRPVRAELWTVLQRHTTVFNLPEIAVAAQRHGRPDVASTLLARTPPAARIELLGELGDKVGLRWLGADSGLHEEDDWLADAAANRLAKLLAQLGEADELASEAEAITRGMVYKDSYADEWLAILLSHRGDVDALASRADAGFPAAGRWLAHELMRRGDREELSRRASGREGFASDRLADLLRESGDLAGLSGLVSSLGEWPLSHAKKRLAELLVEMDDLDELARRSGGDSDFFFTRGLVDLLVRRGDQQELALRAADDEYAAKRLVDLLVTNGDDIELSRLADDGNDRARSKLVDLLGERRDVERLAQLANDDYEAARKLDELLADLGDFETLTRRAAQGSKSAAARLAELLAASGKVDELARRADGGDGSAAKELARLLERTDLEYLARRADIDESAAQTLADRLAEIGDIDRLAERANGGDKRAKNALHNVLATIGDRDGLTYRVDVKHEDDTRLIQLVGARGDLDELERRADRGSWEGEALRGATRSQPDVRPTRSADVKGGPRCLPRA